MCGSRATPNHEQLVRSSEAPVSPAPRLAHGHHRVPYFLAACPCRRNYGRIQSEACGDARFQAFGDDRANRCVARSCSRVCWLRTEVHVADHGSQFRRRFRRAFDARGIAHARSPVGTWTVQRKDRAVLPEPEILAAGDVARTECAAKPETPRCLPCVAQRTSAGTHGRSGCSPRTKPSGL